MKVFEVILTGILTFLLIEPFTYAQLPEDCLTLLDYTNRSGIFNIKIGSCSRPIRVYCDNNLSGGGWIVIQRRMDGSENFYRNWKDYRDGFGNMRGEFFLGLEKIHLLTSSAPQRLIVVLEDYEGIRRYAGYSEFTIANERNRYNLSVLGTYAGNAGDSLTPHKHQFFRTRDVEDPNNCANIYMGGWWYVRKHCVKSNLNGLYLRGITDEVQKGVGVVWSDVKPATYSLRYTRMMIRPTDAVARLRRH